MAQKIFITIRDIAALGMSILLVEQNDRLVLQVDQRGYVMESGAVTLSGAAEELLGSDAVQRAYLGVTGISPALSFFGYQCKRV